MIEDISQFTNDGYWWEEAGLDQSPSMLIKMYHEHDGHTRWQMQDIMALSGWQQARNIFLFECEGWADVSRLKDPRVHLFQSGKIDHPRWHFFPFWIEYVQRAEKEVNYHQLLDYSQPREYWFDALLGAPRTARRWLYNQIVNSQHCDRFILNMYGQEAVHGTEHYNVTNWLTGHNLDDNYSYRTSVTGLPHQVNTDSLLPYRIYNNSWFSVISETHDHASIPIITEKTAKCLLGRRLFIHFGNCGIIQLLKEIGFKTFDCVIDESYDHEPNSEKRLGMAWQQVEFIMQQDPKEVIQKCQKVFDHNQQIVLNYNYDKYVIDELKRLDTINQ